MAYCNPAIVTDWQAEGWFTFYTHMEDIKNTLIQNTSLMVLFRNTFLKLTKGGNAFLGLLIRNNSECYL